MAVVRSHKDLIVWQKSMDLVVAVYQMTKHMPSTEVYGLTAQMHRAAVSLPCNIAEGRRRSTKKDYAHFLSIAFGSAAELETQFDIIERLGFCTSTHLQTLRALLEEIQKMLNSMMAHLRT